MKVLVIGTMTLTTLVAVGCAVRARALAKRAAEIEYIEVRTDEKR